MYLFNRVFCNFHEKFRARDTLRRFRARATQFGAVASAASNPVCRAHQDACTVGQAQSAYQLVTLCAGRAVPVPQHGQPQPTARIAQVGGDLGQRT